jgi:hypothetical protein
MPTTGIEMDTLTLPAAGRDLRVREIGASMVPLWTRHAKTAGAIVYVVDSSNKSTVALSCVEFLEVVASMHELEHNTTPILVLHNKSDMPYRVGAALLKRLLRFDDLKRTTCPAIDFLETSAVTLHNLGGVVDWLEGHHAAGAFGGEGAAVAT